MRLSPNEVEVIREEVRRMDPEAEVYLFGSRADDSARGGDIDLWVRSARIGYADALRLRVRIKDRIGWQKIDLVVSDRDNHPLARLATQTGVRL